MYPLIEVNHVSLSYGSEPVLQDISLHLHPGQFAALVGPSGAGKTSLLKLILGNPQPTLGEVCMHGKALNGQLAPRVGYVPQLDDIDWNFPVTVEQVVLMGRTTRSGLWPWPGSANRQAMREVLERLEIDHLAQNHIRDLSGGQQQRVFLARALVAEPDLLVLDEPTSGVDMRTAENILHMLCDLNQQGITILMTTHDLNAAAAHLPWVVCLNQRIIAQGPPDDVFTEEILSQTYKGDMVVVRQNGMLFVQQKPHPHSYHDVMPDPVPGDLPVTKEEIPEKMQHGHRA